MYNNFGCDQKYFSKLNDPVLILTDKLARRHTGHYMNAFLTIFLEKNGEYSVRHLFEIQNTLLVQINNESRTIVYLFGR